MAFVSRALGAFIGLLLLASLAACGGGGCLAARIAKRNRTEFYRLLGRHQLEPGAFKACAEA